MPAAPALDPTRCPLCGDANRCALEIERATGAVQPPCWCLSATFSDALRARVPPEARALACICARCASTAANPAAAPSTTEEPIP